MLFDTGYSDIFLQNAARMQIDLLHLDCLVFSHGHLDHTWGLGPLIKHYAEAKLQGRAPGVPRLVAHPQVFSTTRRDGFGEIGALLAEDKLARHFRCPAYGPAHAAR